VAQNRHALDASSTNLFNGGFIAYLKDLFETYSAPVHVFRATVLFGSALPLPAARSEVVPTGHALRARSARARRPHGHEQSVLQRLNDLGGEGSMAFKKNTAAFAGVPCRDLCPVPWSYVRAAARKLGLPIGP